MALRFLTDQNFNGDIVSGLLAREPLLDIVRVQDCGLSQTPDEELLEWAARENRVVLTHDKQTMIGYAYSRLASGFDVPGVVHVPQSLPIGQAIDELLIVGGAAQASDFADPVMHLPLNK